MDELTLNVKSLSEDLLSGRHLSDLLGISERTLARLHAERRGPPRIALGKKKVYYYKPAVLDWMLSLQQADTSPKRTYSPRKPVSQQREMSLPSAGSRESLSDGETTGNPVDKRFTHFASDPFPETGNG